MFRQDGIFADGFKMLIFGIRDIKALSGLTRRPKQLSQFQGTERGLSVVSM